MLAAMRREVRSSRPRAHPRSHPSVYTRGVHMSALVHTCPRLGRSTRAPTDTPRVHTSPNPFAPQAHLMSPISPCAPHVRSTRAHHFRPPCTPPSTAHPHLPPRSRPAYNPCVIDLPHTICYTSSYTSSYTPSSGNFHPSYSNRHSHRHLHPVHTPFACLPVHTALTRSQYSSADFRAVANAILDKVPGATLATDIICGAPRTYIRPHMHPHHPRQGPGPHPRHGYDLRCANIREWAYVGVAVCGCGCGCAHAQGGREGCAS